MIQTFTKTISSLTLRDKPLSRIENSNNNSLFLFLNQKFSPVVVVVSIMSQRYLKRFLYC